MAARKVPSRISDLVSTCILSAFRLLWADRRKSFWLLAGSPIILVLLTLCQWGITNAIGGLMPTNFTSTAPVAASALAGAEVPVVHATGAAEVPVIGLETVCNTSYEYCVVLSLPTSFYSHSDQLAVSALSTALAALPAAPPSKVVSVDEGHTYARKAQYWVEVSDDYTGITVEVKMNSTHTAVDYLEHYTAASRINIANQTPTNEAVGASRIYAHFAAAIAGVASAGARPSLSEISLSNMLNTVHIGQVAVDKHNEVTATAGGSLTADGDNTMMNITSTTFVIVSLSSFISVYLPLSTVHNSAPLMPMLDYAGMHPLGVLTTMLIMIVGCGIVNACFVGIMMGVLPSMYSGFMGAGGLTWLDSVFVVCLMCMSIPAVGLNIGSLSRSKEAPVIICVLIASFSASFYSLSTISDSTRFLKYVLTVINPGFYAIFGADALAQVKMAHSLTGAPNPGLAALVVQGGQKLCGPGWALLGANGQQVVNDGRTLFFAFLGAVVVHLCLFYVTVASAPADPKAARRWARVRTSWRLRQPSHVSDETHDVASASNLVISYLLTRPSESEKQIASQPDGRVLRTMECRKEKFHLQALNDVTVTFPRGHVVGLLGVNGAGKTTLTRTFLGMESPAQGSVAIMGLNPAKSPSELMETLPLIGYCPQTNFVAKLSCQTHCELVARVRGLCPTECQSEATRCLEAVGLIRDGKQFAIGTTLSGGQKRRLMVAMAMVGRPALLILDEPSAGLSVDAKVDLDNAIREAARHSSVIITEHDLAEVDGLADTLVIMRDGKVVAEGTSLTLKEEYGSGYTLRVSLQSSSVDVQSVAQKLLETINLYDQTAHLSAISGRDLFFAVTDANALAPVGRYIESVTEHFCIASSAFDLPTLGDVFIALADDKPAELSDEQVVETPKLVLPMSNDKRDPVSKHKILFALMKQSVKNGMRHPLIKQQLIVTVIMSLALNIVFMMVFKQTLGTLNQIATLPGGVIAQSAGGMAQHAWATKVLGNNLDVFFCPAGAVPAALPGSDGPATCSDVDQNAVKELVGRLGATSVTYSQYSSLEALQNNVYSAHKLPPRNTLPDAAALPHTIIEWRSPDFVVIYPPPDLMLMNSLTNVNADVFAAEVSLGTFLEFVRRGYDRGQVQSASVLFNRLNARPFAGVIQSFMSLPSGMFVMIIAVSIGSIMTTLVSVPSTGALAAAYGAATDRLSGLSMLIRTITNDSSNALGWILGTGGFWSLVSSLIVAVIVVFFMVLGTPISTMGCIFIVIMLFVGTFATAITFATVVSWMCYVCKTPESVFKVAPMIQYFTFIPMIAQLVWAISLVTNPLLMSSDRSLTGIQWLIQCLPFCFPQGAPFAISLMIFTDDLYTFNYLALIVGTLAQFVWAALGSWLLSARERAERGAPATSGWGRFWRMVLMLGQISATDVPNPKVEHDVDSDLITNEDNSEMALHPDADFSVVAEAEAAEKALREDDQSNVLVASHVTRLFECDGDIIAALRNVSLLVQSHPHEGTCLALVGENGSGKSTFLSIALGQLRQTLGDTTVKARSIGYVPQTEASCAEMSVAEHCKLFCTLVGATDEYVDAVINVCGLKNEVSKRPGQLSGGYKRRLQLALALITSTELLVADEVAAGVDIHAQRAITQLMDELKNAGTSLVITSHDMASVDRLATRVALLTKGRLRTIGTPDQLKQRYSQGLQVTVQLAPEATSEVAKAWLAEKAGCDAVKVVELPALGGDCRFLVPPTAPATVLDMLEATAPACRPSWILRAAVAPSSLTSVFLRLEAESRALGLTNIM